VKERNRKGMFRAAESVAYKMNKHHGFDQVSWMAFQEAALEKYDFASSSCKSGEKMTFGKCQKVGGSEDKEKKKKKDTEVAAITDAGMDKAAKMYGGSNQKRVDAIRKSLGEINAAARATREA
jgi:hypothetical protein